MTFSICQFPGVNTAPVTNFKLPEWKDGKRNGITPYSMVFPQKKHKEQSTHLVRMGQSSAL